MRTRIALVLTSLTALVVLAPSVAHAAEPWAAADDDLTLVSQGYGHGIGMSQYGAKGRADDGQKAEEILDFYYPGTTAGKAAGLVRVWITADSDANTIVRPAKGLRVIDLATGKSYLLPVKKGLTAWRMTFVAGKTRVAWLKAGTWRFYRPGGKVLSGAGEFRSSANALNLYYAGKNHPYRGAMRLVGGRTVNVLALDNYLKGVIASEMPALWATEALKSQAIAARTYAAFERADYATRSFHVYDTTRSQVYSGIVAEHPNASAAIAATAGQVRLFAGKPAFTQFSASNGGWTASGGKPYLVSKDDPFDTAYQDRTLTIGPLTKAKIQKKYPKLGTLEQIRVLTRGADKRVTTVQLDGSASNDVRVSGSDFRSLVGARSSYFAFTS